LEQDLQLLTAGFQAHPVSTVHHPDQTIGAFEVVPPVGS